jgi:hypothetical protein
MGPSEIQWRIKHHLVTHVERIAYKLDLYTWSPRKWQRRLCCHVETNPVPPELANWWKCHMRTRNEPPFLLNAESLKESSGLFRKLFFDQLAAAVSHGDRVCRGEFSFLGIEFRTGPTVDWQSDPKTGRSWPTKFYVDVNVPFCDGTGSQGVAGDAKHVWELNRHDFLVDCAKAYRLTHDDRFARHVFRTITDWIDANPYLQGVNWAGPLEVALRSMNWIWAYQFCRDWEGLSANDHLQVIKSCYQHGAFLYRHLEVYSSPNNHLVGEATALYLLGSFFPEFDRSAAWRNRAWSILESHSDRQFHDDGGSTEQATSYHHYCLGFFVLAVLTRMRQDLPVPAAMLERLEAAFSFSMWMTTPNGTVPWIGDTDDARSIRFGTITPWDFRTLLSLGATMFRRGDMKAIAETYSEDALWLLGPHGLRTFQGLPNTPPAQNSQLFSSSGYAIVKSDWERNGHHICFDCGQIGRDLRNDDVPIFTHGHADMLSLTISAHGEPLLVDGGFYTYNGLPDWHRYTRDVQAHNTVRVDGQSQANFHHRNAWSCVSEPGPIHYRSDETFEIVEGSHSGFVGVKDCTRHRRLVAWDRKSDWLIFDRLEGSGIHLIEAFFHFAPGCLSILSDGGGVMVTTDRGIQAVLQCANRDSLFVDARCGESEPDGGWIATGYGCKVPAPVVRFHGHVQLPFTMCFLLSSSIGEVVRPAMERIDVADSCDDDLSKPFGLRIRSSEGEYSTTVRWNGEEHNSLTLHRDKSQLRPTVGNEPSLAPVAT